MASHALENRPHPLWTYGVGQEQPILPGNVNLLPPPCMLSASVYSDLPFQGVLGWRNLSKTFRKVLERSQDILSITGTTKYPGGVVYSRLARKCAVRLGFGP